MKYDAELVEFVVQEVIRRLIASGLAMPANATGDLAVGDLPARDLVISERLVTLATVQGRLAGVARVVVPRRAVISPAVRDELRSRSIELSRN